MAGRMVLVKVWQLLVVRVLVVLGSVAVLATVEGLTGGGPR